MERADYLEAIKSRMPEKRYIHTMGVMETAIHLAEKYGENVKSAETAAILHDIAKYADENWMIQIVKDNDLDQRLITWGPELLHGPVGAWIAENEFNIHDEDLLNSIRFHTTGRAGMSKLEKILYIADMIEPNRNFDGVEKLRSKADEDLNKAMRACIRHSIKYLVKTKQKIYPVSIECYNDLIELDEY
ncbi:phosphohydrolase [Ureibacillus massiliensis 4400831 = CIP 108448 = CCUG 49529]|uniref:bis(5'-nucleosyl)-tetraphosphatase (symmetrical) n=1 Tax=Ureibacillus massiliensis 4400831 = CIP 108448 = CCUG 49529 TaxID=1211035 RepID=A0A0A3J1A3_9BACL|nr:bis(5'-nucleosyl)-tetraphosphatase (symmetrical) YqeK [Ureibacillus massiliensis]KGR90721.1 phosphohydrolase [Ureibacillus massiliensis 4400831 = CIP 108448 = CCUG 49529]